MSTKFSASRSLRLHRMQGFTLIELLVVIAIIAILPGRSLNRRMTGHGFLRLVHLGLILIGALLLFQAFTTF